MAEPFSVSAHTSAKNIETWAREQSWNTKIESKVGQDGQTVLYAKKMGRFEALFHRTTKEQRVSQARRHVEVALQTDPPVFKPAVQGSGKKMLSLGQFGQLSESFRKSDEFQTLQREFAVALGKGNADKSKVCGERLADVIAEELQKQPFSEQMRFALADTDTLAKELLSMVLTTAQEQLEKSGGDVLALPPNRLDVLGSRVAVLQSTVDRVLSNLSDRALSDKKMMVNGHVYIRDANPLGAGAFGTTYIYRAENKAGLKSGEPATLVVKSPADSMGLGAKESMVSGPLREARALVNATGTGAAEFAGNVAKFHTAIRGVDGSVQVVMRLEEGGSSEKVFNKALKRLGSVEAEKKISAEQYEDLTLTLIKDAIRGAMRFHEMGQVAHFDLKIDNILVSAEGTGRVADPGASRGLGDTDRLDSPTNTGHFTPIAYTAPEKFLGGQTTAASDVFSLGMTLLEALSQNGPISLFKSPQTHPLFAGTDVAPTMSDVRQRVTEWARDPNAVMLSPEFVRGTPLEKYADLINRMTSPSPGRRPTLEEVLADPVMNQPGQGGPEIRNLIKSLALPKPAAPPAPAPSNNSPTTGYVGDRQPAVPSSLRRVYVGEESAAPEDASTVGSETVLSDVGETKDETITADWTTEQKGAPAAEDASTEEKVGDTPMEMTPINAYVSTMMNPGGRTTPLESGGTGEAPVSDVAAETIEATESATEEQTAAPTTKWSPVSAYVTVPTDPGQTTDEVTLTEESGSLLAESGDAVGSEAATVSPTGAYATIDDLKDRDNDTPK